MAVLSALVSSGAILIERGCREATPLERNVTHPHSAAGWLDFEFSTRRCLHGRNRIGTRAVSGWHRWVCICHRRSFQGLHERILHIVKSALFHALEYERFELGFVNFYGHRDGSLHHYVGTYAMRVDVDAGDQIEIVRKSGRTTTSTDSFEMIRTSV
jgi:hypothetical protein